MDNLITLTPEIIDALSAPAGGYSSAAVRAMGMAWPPMRGWKRKIVGLAVPAEPVRALLRKASDREGGGAGRHMRREMW